MTLRHRSLFVSLALLAATLARAEDAPARPPVARSLSPVLGVLDSDHNGTLSAAEIAAAPTTLRALDLNDDGVISPAERRAAPTSGRPNRTRQGLTTLNVVLTLDANLDGDLQLLEIANAVSSLKRLDLNRDGQLTPDELRPVIVAQHRI